MTHERIILHLGGVSAQCVTSVCGRVKNCMTMFPFTVPKPIKHGHWHKMIPINDEEDKKESKVKEKKNSDGCVEVWNYVR